MPRERVVFHSGGLRLVGDLYLPIAEGPVPGVVVLHGLGSRKERHEDFGVLAAQHGLAALAFDMRGHGESEGQLDANAWQDVAAAVDLLAARPEVASDCLAIRGSSLGGHYAIHAAALLPALRTCVAICPAPEWLMLEGASQVLEQGAPLPAELRADPHEFLRYLRGHDLAKAVAQIAPRALLLIHASGDDVVPAFVSQRLYEAAGEPKELWLLPDGSHTSAQHDPALNARLLAWLQRQFTP